MIFFFFCNCGDKWPSKIFFLLKWDPCLRTLVKNYPHLGDTTLYTLTWEYPPGVITNEDLSCALPCDFILLQTFMLKMTFSCRRICKMSQTYELSRVTYIFHEKYWGHKNDKEIIGWPQIFNWIFFFQWSSHKKVFSAICALGLHVS